MMTECSAVLALFAQGQAGGLMTFLPLVLIMVIFYFLLILPAQRRQKKTKQMLQALKNGDKVITNGGIYGTDRGPGRRNGSAAHRRSGEDQAVAQRHRRTAAGTLRRRVKLRA